MSIENLMKPRYKVIADYLHSPYELGDIVEQVTDVRFVATKHCGINTLVHSDKLNQMSHLFQRLEWWVDREISEMPEYVKQIGMMDGFDNPIPDVYLKVKRHFNAGNEEWRDNSINIFCADSYLTTLKNCSYSYSAGWLPATELEYTEYLNTLNKQQ